MQDLDETNLKPDPTYRPKKKTPKWLAAERFMVANPMAPNLEVVRACKVSPRLVSQVRAYLRDSGRIPPAHGDWTDRSYRPSPMGVDDLLRAGAEDVGKIMDSAAAAVGHELPIEDQLRTCKILSGAAHAPQVRLAALIAYNKIKAETAAREQLGPAPPLTDEDKVRRLTNLLRASGPALAVAAFRAAFTPEQKESDGEADQAAAPPGVPEALPEVRHEAGGQDGDGGPGGDDLGPPERRDPDVLEHQDSGGQQPERPDPAGAP